MKSFGDKISCTQILNLMVILGFMVNYMLRVNLPIAITAMVKETRNTSINGTNNHTGNVTYVPKDDPNMFQWDKYQQNLIFGIFFCGYVLTELPGGRLAEIFGTKRIFGGGMLTASLLTLLTPLACHLGFITVVVLRGALGLALGATWASIPPMAVKWIPPMDRSKFIANMLASMLGAAITLPVCGLLIESFGWPASFYFTGGTGTIWCISWFFLIYDSPTEHPRISIDEKITLESKLAESKGGRKPKSVPWLRLLSSGPVWAIIIAHGCSIACSLTMIYQLPTYMKEVLHYNVRENGLFSSLPYLGYYAMSVFSSYLADKMRKSGKYSTTIIRKVFTTCSLFLPAVCMALQAVFGKDPTLSVVIFTCTLFLNGAMTGGFLSNALDIAPNFSGTIFGLANALASFGGYISTVIVARLTNDNHTFQQWSYIFWLLAAVYTVGNVVYLILGSGQLQPWNSTDCEMELIPEQKPLKNENLK